jgi:hypothetical protein
MKTRITTLLFVLLTVATASAQELLEMIKRDINAERRSIIAEAVKIPITVETEFWQMYNEMEVKLDKITDRRAANIKKFADNYENVTDDVANELANNYFDMNIERYKIYKTYYKKASKIISKKEAARFLQLIGQIQLLIDVQIAAEVPLIE